MPGGIACCCVTSNIGASPGRPPGSIRAPSARVGIIWLGIIGGPGTSKTRCLSLLCRNLINQGHRPTWITACDIQHLLAITRHGTEPEKRDASRRLRHLRTTPILFLDDLGKNTWSPTYEATLFDIVDHRKTNYLPLNWSANTHPHQILASGELTTERGGPLMSRLPEASQIIYA
jgi:DNA replication protein DnaC